MGMNKWIIGSVAVMGAVVAALAWGSPDNPACYVFQAYVLGKYEHIDTIESYGSSGATVEARYIPPPAGYDGFWVTYSSSFEPVSVYRSKDGVVLSQGEYDPNTRTFLEARSVGGSNFWIVLSDDFDTVEVYSPRETDPWAKGKLLYSASKGINELGLYQLDIVDFQ